MKTKKLSIAIALLAVAVIGTSCGNKQQKSSSDTTTEQTTSSALEIDSLLANAELQRNVFAPSFDGYLNHKLVSGASYWVIEKLG